MDFNGHNEVVTVSSFDHQILAQQLCTLRFMTEQGVVLQRAHEALQQTISLTNEDRLDSALTDCHCPN
jgi:hypothetical protein